MFDDDPIPVREEPPEYPAEFRGQRLLGVDAYHFAHYWRGDRIEIVERTNVLRTEDGDARLEAEFETKGFVAVDRIPGGPATYLREIGTYLDGVADDADPVYAADDSQWERVTDYARSLASSSTDPSAADRSYGARSRFGRNHG
ncbi:hypothetical protein G9464_13230 [Halostella sp. JP-L12]|uniref:hypothetical protein n=1 Tax=Halostella TaxID=1843185 RepID=UPI000EF7CD19|nr:MULTISPECIES: hypothetical protein [Halostella]NHN48548.1 hypothetical protein [Halostella sp. JP-L12]